MRFKMKFEAEDATDHKRYIPFPVPPEAYMSYYYDYACPNVVICFIESLESSGTLKSFHEVDVLGSQDEYFDFSINL